VQYAGALVFESPTEALSQTIHGYHELLELLPVSREPGSVDGVENAQPEPSPEARAARERELTELRARLAIVLEESARSDEARVELATLERAGQDALASAIRTAYGPRASDAASTVDPRAPDAASTVDARALDALGPGWAKDRVRIRLAEQTGDAATLNELALASRASSDRWLVRALIAALASLLPMAIGLPLFLVWLWKDRPTFVDADARIPPDWSWDDGCAVLVRAATGGFVVLNVVGYFGSTRGIEPTVMWITLLASLPMLWWIQRGLIAPNGLAFGRTFGLWSRSNAPALDPYASRNGSSPDLVRRRSFARKAAAWTVFTLGMLAIHQLGATAIEIVCRNFGVESHWSEAVPELMIWAPTPKLALSAIDAVAWAPVFEEIGCRGLLFMTLRRRVGPLSAALTSAMLFAMPHQYSLPGFLSVAWTGFVFALAFERCKSLVPGMVCHALWNASLLVNVVLLYR
jgi:membrane protease YdiL (CAAX protease family)